MEGSVRFSLAERQLKLFKNALQSLQKIGSDLLVEALTGRLVLRSINTTRSAYMSVTFDARFFDEYHVFDCTVVQAGILMKHILSTFRTQRVNKIVFELKTVDSRAVVTLHCDNGLLKSYKIPSMDAEILQATVDKEAFPTCVVAESGAMSKLLSSFHTGLEEVTIIAYGDAGRQQQQQQQGAVPSKAVQLHSFLDPLKGHADKSLFTQLAVDTREVFLSYSHNSEGDADVTFNLKDFKAMLSLCENLNSNVMLRFEGPGQPLVVEPHFPTALGQEVDYEAELILATLVESHGLPRMDDAGGGGANNHLPSVTNGALHHGAGTQHLQQQRNPAADSWLGAPSHLQAEQPGSVRRSLGHPAAGTWHEGGAAGMDSPGLVPSGLLEEPLEERRNGGAGGRSGPHISLSRRSGSSRLGMPAAAGEQSIARGGLPAGSAFDLIDRDGGGSWETGEEGDDEIPSTPPEWRQDGQDLASVMPGAIPTQRPTARQ